MHSIDRDKLVSALFEGRQKKAISFIHPKDVHFTDDVVKYEYSPEKAKALLEKSGWKKGASGIYEKDGKKLSLTIMTTAQNKSRELVEVFIQQQLKQAGIDLAIQNEPARVFFGETLPKRKSPALAMYTWTSTPDMPHRTELHSTEIPSQKNGYSGQNFPGWRNAAVDQLIDAFLKEFDIKKRSAILQKVQKAYTEEVPVMPLYMRSDIAFVPATLKNFRLSGHQYYTTLEIETWKLEGAGGR